MRATAVIELGIPTPYKLMWTFEGEGVQVASLKMNAPTPNLFTVDKMRINDTYSLPVGAREDAYFYSVKKQEFDWPYGVKSVEIVGMYSGVVPLGFTGPFLLMGELECARR